MSKVQIGLLAVLIAGLSSTLAAGPLSLVLDDGHPAAPEPANAYLVDALGGDVNIYFAGGLAGYTSELYVAVLGTIYSPSYFLFQNNASSPQAPVTLAGLPAGAELVFSLVVDGGRYIWYSGPRTRNADGAVHAALCQWEPDEFLNVSGTFIGFEDWPADPGSSLGPVESPGHGDFNDLMIVVTGVTPRLVEEVPEPGSFLLVSGALLAVWLGSRRRR